jgi:hypothetical protein
MKKHIPLIIGIALPFVFIILIAAVVYLPNTFINPQHDFIYTTADQYNYNYIYKNVFEIKNGKLVLNPVVMSTSTVNNYRYENRIIEDAPKLYRYSIEKSSINEISFAEAEKLSLDPGPTSPDGYTVEYRYAHDGIFELFGSNNNNNGYFISKGNGGKKLPAINTTTYRYNDGNFKFIGWVK